MTTPYWPISIQNQNYVLQNGMLRVNTYFLSSYLLPSKGLIVHAADFTTVNNKRTARKQLWNLPISRVFLGSREMWRSSLGSDEQQACHAPWTGLDIPLIYSLNGCGINWSIQQEKDKKEKTPSTKPAIMLNNQTSLLACASTGWNIQWDEMNRTKASEIYVWIRED